MENVTDKKEVLLDITLDSKWDYIQLTRLLIESVMDLEDYGKDMRDKIAVAVAELLENAIRYAHDEGMRLVLEREMCSGKKYMNLIVSNYSKKEKAHEVVELVDQMSQEDPLQFYIAKLKESIAHKHIKQYGLGLARIYHEGEATIKINYNEDNQVIDVTTRFNLG